LVNVLNRVLVFASYICCSLVLLSFAMFASDQLAGASAHQQREVVAGINTSPPPRHRRKPEGQPRRFIDGAAGVLTSPFESIVQSDNVWVLHVAPALIALLFYGVGLGFLARYAAGMS
jgi:hypothetical protein